MQFTFSYFIKIYSDLIESLKGESLFVDGFKFSGKVEQFTDENNDEFRTTGA